MFNFLNRPHEVATFDLPFFVPTSKISASRLLLFLAILSSIFTRPVSFHLDTKLTESSVFLPMLEVAQVIFIVHVAGLTIH
jgi:hypothetical protein